MRAANPADTEEPFLDEPVTPELALVSPELAERARAELRRRDELARAREGEDDARGVQEDGAGGVPARPPSAEAETGPKPETGWERLPRSILPLIVLIVVFLATTSSLLVARKLGPLESSPPESNAHSVATSGRPAETTRTDVAPGEPPPEMAPLTERALLLASSLAGAARPSKAVVKRWRSVHAAIVAGARAGRPGGAEALRILIQIDQDLETRWGIGADAEATARVALAEITKS